MPSSRPSLIRSPSPALIAMAGALVAATSLAAEPPPSPYSQPQPVRPNLPGSAAEEVGLTVQPTLAREGTFVASARGQAIKGKSGRWFFVFDPDAAGHVLPPMVLLPNLYLSTVERAAERNPPGTRLLATGRVTVYQGLNYLLLGAPPLLVRADEPAAAPSVAPTPPAPSSVADQPTAAETGVKDSPAPKPTGEPSIDEIVNKLDKAASKVAATSPQRASSTSSGSSKAETPEPGTSRALTAPGLISSRRGRITRAADSAMVFTFDSGTGDQASGPLIILPNQNLATVEQISERGGGGEGATYTVTGEVMTFRGRNYLLLRSYQANRATDQVLPAQ